MESVFIDTCRQRFEGFWNPLPPWVRLCLAVPLLVLLIIWSIIVVVTFVCSNKNEN